MVIKPLYGHTSLETSYLVPDYPYSFRLRCKIRYFIEKDAKKGFRMVSQTTNPKKSMGHIDVWNAPKKTTYVNLAACMYLDENDHVQWSGISAFSEAEKILEFVQNFPEADLSNVKDAVLVAKAMAKRTASGKANFTIAGFPSDPGLTDIERANKELEVLEKVWLLLLPKF